MKVICEASQICSKLSCKHTGMHEKRFRPNNPNCSYCNDICYQSKIECVCIPFDKDSLLAEKTQYRITGEHGLIYHESDL